MIVYRMTSHPDSESWANEFHATKDAAVRAARRVPFPVVVEAVEIPGGRAGVVEALNRAEANPTVWPGTVVFRGDGVRRRVAR